MTGNQLRNFNSFSSTCPFTSTLIHAFNMHSTLVWFFPVVSALVSQRELNDPGWQYLGRLCLPLFHNQTRIDELNLSLAELIPSLAYSPFPCEQQLYIQTVCTANGTTEIDFLAEQECLCNGSYFEAALACDDCYDVHGYTDYTPAEQSSSVTSLSIAECSPSPPYQPFSNLLPPANIASLEASPPITLGTDLFPNNTAVNNYFTVTASMTPGQITGSATGRLTIITNISGIRYTPTNSPTTAPTSSSYTSAAGSSSPSPSKNVAAIEGTQITSCILSVILGLVMLL